MSKNMAAVVAFSGGIDSTVSLLDAVNRGYKPTCLFFDYGQKLRDYELSRASLVSKMVSDFYPEADVTFDKVVIPINLWKGVSGITGDKEKEDTYTEINDNSFWDEVPLRNLLFLSICRIRAQFLGTNMVFMGLRNSGILDTREDFSDAFIGISSVCGYPTSLYTHGRRSLRNVLEKGLSYNGFRDLLPHLITCNHSPPPGCGVCYKCKSKSKTFLDMGWQDPFE